MNGICNRGILIVAMTAAVASILVSYVLIGDLRIPSSGQLLTSVTAVSGSVSDIQAAINEAISDGIPSVKIPPGTWSFAANGSFPGPGTYVSFTVPPMGLRIFGAGINRTILKLPDESAATSTTMFHITGGHKDVDGVWHSGGRLRISNITFKGRSPTGPGAACGDVAIWIESCKDFRVDHCSFHDMGSNDVYVNDHYTQYGITGGDPARVSQGVVDHNGFYNTYKQAAHQAGNGYGYASGAARASHYLWEVWDDNIWNVIGVYDKNVFIEDNYFIGTRHAASASNAGVFVFRHNIVNNQGMPEASNTGHPVRTNTYGMRAYEIYDNIIAYDSTLGQGTKFRGPLCKGGGGVIFNNTISELIAGVLIGNAEVVNPYYPKGNVKDLYIWNNSIVNCDQDLYISVVEGMPLPVDGIDFFSDLTGTHTTSQVQALLDAQHYSPYTYPHPLMLEGELQSLTTTAALNEKANLILGNLTLESVFPQLRKYANNNYRLRIRVE